MKSIYQLALGLVLSVLAQSSQAQEAHASFFTENGEKFSLYLNGVLQNQYPMSTIKVTSLTGSPNGTPYVVKVVFETDTLGQINDKVYMMPYREKNYVIKRKTSNVFQEKGKRIGKDLNLTKTVADSSQVEKFVIRTLSENAISTAPQGSNYQNNPQPAPAGNVTTTTTSTTVNSGNTVTPGVSLSVNIPGPGTTTTTTTYGTTSYETTTQLNTTGTTTGNVAMSGCYAALTPAAFSPVKARVAQQRIDAGRIQVAKTVSDENCLASSQVLEISKLFIDNRLRMDYVKYAYLRVFDPQNYELLNNAFYTTQEVMELQGYVQSMPRTNPGYQVVVQPYPAPQQPQQPVQSQVVYYVPGYSGPTNCPVPMRDADFQSAKNTISAKSFDDSKLTIAKQITQSNCLTAQQVKEIASLFSFEQTKLDYAKYAYSYTYDKGNYFKLNDIFSFETSVEELNSAIQGK